MKNLRGIFAFLHPFISPFLRNVLIVIVLLGLTEIFLVIRIPFVNADLINALVNSHWDIFKHLAIIVLMLFAGQLLVGFCNKYLFVLFNENLEKNIRNSIFSYLLSQSVRFTEKHSTGDILSRLLNDTPKIKGFITGVVVQFCFDVLAIIIAFSILIHRSWVLSLIVFAFAPLAVFAGSFFKAKISTSTREQQEKAACFTGKAQTWISRFTGIKIYGLETVSYKQFEGDSQQYAHAAISAGKWNILMGAINVLFLGAPSILVLIVGGYYCLQGFLSIGELFAFLTFSTYFIAPLQRIIALINVELPRMYPIYERFREFGMMDKNTRDSAPHARCSKNNRNSGVRFSGNPGDDTVITDSELNTIEIKDLEYENNGFKLSVPYLSFQKGKVYGINGVNGSGKSTLAKILKGLLPMQTGKNSFDEHDTFLLSQDSYFFDGSLQDNVTLFECDRDMIQYREIIRSLDMEKFEQQVAGIVNAEQSRMLSGGELQKVNIARLMYSHHRVLILDEPDSFTDSSTKSTLMKWIAATKHDKIILVITHDKELLDICDTVYVLEQIGIKHSIINI